MAVAGDTVYPTVAELAGLGVWVSQSITGLDFPAGYEHQLLGSGSISLSITKESAKALGYPIEDLSVELHAPGVHKSDCCASHTWAGLSIEHRNNVGVYGPHPAHTHTDWIPGGGAGNVTSEGQFNVSGNLGSLTLNLSSGYEDRLQAIPAQDFPEGMPGAPHLYWYHKADLWRAYHGSPGLTTGTPFNCPYEAVYCWRGWSYLSQRIIAAYDSTLSLVARGKTFTFSDPHVNGSARQTDFTYSAATFAHTYELVAPAGDNFLYFCLPKPHSATKGKVDLEVVEALEISGFEVGNWTLYEPKLVLDPREDVTSHVRIKAFEAPCQDGDTEHSGSGYRHGGLSCRTDAAYWKAMHLGDESNANLDEPTLPYFDKLLSANYELDLTVAFTLPAMSDLLNNYADAFTCSMGSHYLSATSDGTNQLGTWGFDVVPLTQGGDSGDLLCALRCGQWTVARGISCDIVTDKYIGGQLHGLAYSGNDLVCAGNYVDVWRKAPGGTWGLYRSNVTAQLAGHWDSGNLPEVASYTGDTPNYYLYGIVLSGGSAPTTGVSRAGVRENTAWVWVQTSAGGKWVALEHLFGTGRYRAWGGVDGALTVELAGRSQVLSGSLYYSSPNLLRLDARGEAVLVCGYGDDTEVRTNEGGQWSVPTTIREDRSHPCACVLLPTSDLYVIGLTDGLAYGQRVFYKGSGSYEIGTEDLVYSDVLESDCEVRQTPLGVLEFLFHDGNGQLCMVSSEDCGETWS